MARALGRLHSTSSVSGLGLAALVLPLFVAGLAPNATATARSPSQVEAHSDAAALRRIEKTLPVVEELDAKPGRIAFLDLMLHAPTSMRFDLDRPSSVHAEVRLAPLKAQTASAYNLSMKLAAKERAVVSLQPDVQALSVKLGQPTEMSAPALTTLAAASVVKAKAPSERPPGRRVSAVADEGRVFWYAMGASALTSLGTRVFLFFPALIIAIPIGFVGAVLGPIATLLMVVGLISGIAVIDAALAALAGAFVFDSMSRFYKASFLSGFAGQILGSAVAASVVGVMAGFGLLYVSGVESLVQFVGTQILVGIQALSILGLMPVVVLGFFATVVFPAVGGAWAMSVTATPIDGFKVDPTWDPDPLLGRAHPTELRRQERRVYTPVRVAIPGT